VNQAKNNYNLAISNWSAQNEEWFFQRDFSRARNFALLAEKAARQAVEEAISHENSLSESLSVDINELKAEVKQIQPIFKTFPFGKETKNKFTQGALLLSEAEIAYQKEDYLSCKTKVANSKSLLTESIKSAKLVLKSEFRHYDRWLELKDYTVNWSRQNGAYACLVDKFNRKMYIYKNGKVVQTFHVELGPNWLGDKMIQGDNATPEGRYLVTKKKKGVHTRYYKALLINYPNEQDLAEFKELKKKGIISKRAKSGGLIEIHGDGGRGFDWTNGCVAVTNKEMDKIYEIADIGMPVTIVGSLTSLNEILTDATLINN
jgi:murein L,D-transpeptidase YafK